MRLNFHPSMLLTLGDSLAFLKHVHEVRERPLRLSGAMEGGPWTLQGLCMRPRTHPRNAQPHCCQAAGVMQVHAYRAMTL